MVSTICLLTQKENRLKTSRKSWFSVCNQSSHTTSMNANENNANENNDEIISSSLTAASEITFKTISESKAKTRRREMKAVNI